MDSVPDADEKNWRMNMAEVKFDRSQMDAINIEKNTVVSAGAGSGTCAGNGSGNLFTSNSGSGSSSPVVVVSSN